ncbi:MAG: Na+/H+ antiporter subunit E [Clostridiales bacterium]|jgi:multicomponent Na+:H+ antiporter subunit E|nr:Na+/H+ antiporter subunit E [Clostridiales bacterium]
MPILFFIFWIALNSRITVEVVVLGVIVSVLVSLFAYRLLGLSFKGQLATFKMHGKYLPSYIFTLIVEVIKANAQMIRIILSPKMDIDPTIVYFESPVKHSFSKIMLAYTIALTPGTILFELDGDRIGIHAIKFANAEVIKDWKQVKKLKKSEGS